MLVQLALLAIAILSLVAASIFNLSIVTLVVYQSMAMAVVYVIALFSARATIRVGAKSKL